MSLELKIFDDILNSGMRPWLRHNSVDEAFYSKFHSLKEYSSKHPLHFEIDFPRPFDNKTKYYNLLIRNAIKSQYDIIYEKIDKDRNENLIHYYLDKILNKRLATKLRDVGILIKQKDYALSYIDPKNTSYQLDQAHRANSYIIQLLKLALMQLYLEIQESLKEYVKDTFIVEDFYTQLLKEPIPDKLPISKIQILEIEPEQIKISKSRKNESTIHFNSFFYKQYNTSPEKLHDLWDSLKLNKFISSDTPLPTFKKIFSGAEINNPVKWIGNPSELSYFIKCIHNKYKLIDYLKQQHWKVTCLCFVDENGTPFHFTQFRRLERPSLTGDKIDKAVNLLK